MRSGRGGLSARPECVESPPHPKPSLRSGFDLSPQAGRGKGASNAGALDLPFVLEYVALGVLGLDAETLRAVRDIAEPDIRILGNRNSAFHRQHQAVVLPHPQFVDEEGRNIELRDLVHLQAGIVRMTDHDLGFARPAYRPLAGLGKLPEAHLA